MPESTDTQLLRELAERIAAPADRRVDRFLQGAFAVGLLAWSGFLYNTSQTVVKEQRQTRLENSRNTAQLRLDAALLVEKQQQMVDEFTRHRDRFAHDGARDELSRLSAAMDRLNQALTNMKATGKTREQSTPWTTTREPTSYMTRYPL